MCCGHSFTNLTTTSPRPPSPPDSGCLRSTVARFLSCSNCGRVAFTGDGKLPKVLLGLPHGNYRDRPCPSLLSGGMD
jgi:hypothetical protein